MEFRDTRNTSCHERKIPLDELPRTGISGEKINEIDHMKSSMQRGSEG